MPCTAAAIICELAPGQPAASPSSLNRRFGAALYPRADAMHGGQLSGGVAIECGMSSRLRRNDQCSVCFRPASAVPNTTKPPGGGSDVTAYIWLGKLERAKGFE